VLWKTGKRIATFVISLKIGKSCKRLKTCPRDTCEYYRETSMLFAAPNTNSLSETYIENPIQNCCNCINESIGNNVIFGLQRVLFLVGYKREENVATYLLFLVRVHAYEQYQQR
jgi:hypothetical protein